MLLTTVIFSCSKHPALRNQTRAAGYAKGENILLTFKTKEAGSLPDSIQAFVLEKKTGYEYVLWAKKGACDSLCSYSTFWDGRKPDGSWPLGGAYLVYAKSVNHTSVYSDTVQIGLGD